MEEELIASLNKLQAMKNECAQKGIPNTEQFENLQKNVGRGLIKMLIPLMNELSEPERTKELENTLVTQLYQGWRDDAEETASILGREITQTDIDNAIRYHMQSIREKADSAS